MKTNHQILQELNEAEIKNGLYTISINKVPLWRIVRFNVRIKYLNDKTGFKNKTSDRGVGILELIKYFFLSFFQLVKIFFFKRTEKNLIVAFPRLFEVNDSFIDKFTDPVIYNTELKKDYIIFQHSFGRSHFQPRKGMHKVIYCDFIDIISRVLSIIVYPFFLFKYNNLFNELIDRMENKYNNINKKAIIEDFIIFEISQKIYSFLFRRMNIENLFIVNRQIFNFIIYSAKNNNINVYEFQHGITQTETPLYTGPYIEGFDPDNFLVFGEAWINEYYGIPKEKIINIGWAYRDYVKKALLEINNATKDTFLVISSPAITQKLLDFVFEAIEFNNNFKFDLRLHPQEKMNPDQLKLIDVNPNVRVIDNKEESVFSISRYEVIIGDNSSVLYEALSIGKKVGKINMNQIFTRKIEEDLKNGFYIISNFNDLILISNKQKNSSSEYYYSTFEPEKINQLIK